MNIKIIPETITHKVTSKWMKSKYMLVLNYRNIYEYLSKMTSFIKNKRIFNREDAYYETVKCILL